MGVLVSLLFVPQLSCYVYEGALIVFFVVSNAIVGATNNLLGYHFD